MCISQEAAAHWQLTEEVGGEGFREKGFWKKKKTWEQLSKKDNPSSRSKALPG